MSKGKQKVAIIGAGIVGVSTAIWLQRDGHDVILIDKSGPGEGTSYGNGGILASCSLIPIPVPGLITKAPRMLFDPNQPLFLKWGYLPRLMPWLLKYLGHANASSVKRRAEALFPIIGDSLADHEALSKGTDAEKWLVPSDYLYVYDDRKHYESDGFGWSVRESHGFKLDILEGQEFHDYDPAFSPDLGCAVRLKNHGYLTDPGRYIKDLAKHFESNGGRIVTGEVDDIVRENGKVTGVRIAGETIECGSAILTAGIWSSALAKKLGLHVPMETERGYHVEFWEPSIMPRSPAMVASGKFVMTPMDGRLRLAGVVEFGGLEAPPSDAPVALLKKNVETAIPGISWKNTTEWMGHRPSIVDSIPVIGEVPSVKGAYVGFGHDHIGLTGGPKTGRILSQLVSGKRPNLDLAFYSPSRFQ